MSRLFAFQWTAPWSRGCVAALLIVLGTATVKADTCFQANSLAVHGTAKWILDNCKQTHNATLDYDKLVKRGWRARPDLVAECMNSCRRGEPPDSCVKRFIGRILASFDRANRGKLRGFCLYPKY
ncbi:MAG: hypothetical protein R3D31_10580 [Hyphomicrobiaceae bacterium]